MSFLSANLTTPSKGITTWKPEPAIFSLLTDYPIHYQIMNRSLMITKDADRPRTDGENIGGVILFCEPNGEDVIHAYVLYQERVMGVWKYWVVCCTRHGSSLLSEQIGKESLLTMEILEREAVAHAKDFCCGFKEEWVYSDEIYLSRNKNSFPLDESGASWLSTIQSFVDKWGIVFIPLLAFSFFLWSLL
jgi:hypothetical protein